LTSSNIVETITNAAELRAENTDITMVEMERARLPDLVPAKDSKPVVMKMTEVQIPVPVGTPRWVIARISNVKAMVPQRMRTQPRAREV